MVVKIYEFIDGFALVRKNRGRYMTTDKMQPEEPVKEKHYKPVPDDISSQERSKQYWENWLPQDLGLRLHKVKNFVEVQYKQYEKNMSHKWYTPHDINHCKSVENYLHRLLPDQHYKSLSEYERFFLLASAWLHDIGMLPIFDKDDKDKPSEEIRSNHHIRSEQYINANFAEIGLLEYEANILGVIARFHRRKIKIDKCQHKIAFPNGVVRLRLLAAYLRLADALHTDQSRAPSEKFAIALAYNIPYYAKLHWLKSKFIIGIDVNPSIHEIILHIKNPANLNDVIPVKFKAREIEKKIKSILKDNIIQDLQDELDSVSKILIDEGITYYLRVTHKEHNVQFDKALLKDVCTALDERVLLYHPSSSSLYSIVAETFKEILTEEAAPKVIIENATVFLQNIRLNVVSSRFSHYGLLKILEGIGAILEDNNSLQNAKQSKMKIELYELISGICNRIVLNKEKIRNSAKRYFHKYFCNPEYDCCYNLLTPIDEIVEFLTKEETFGGISKYKTLDTIEDEIENDTIVQKKIAYRVDTDWMATIISESRKKVVRPIRVLLFGYSECAIRALCGMRDAIIELLIEALYSVKENTHQELIDKLKYVEHFKLPLEKIASNFFEIFVCEAQPKNQISEYGRITYHDGWHYASALTKRKFTQVFMIPDAVVGHLIEVNDSTNGNNIDIVLVGANGYTKDHFFHSAGHSTIINLCSSMLFSSKILGNFKCNKIDVILVTSTIKYASSNMLKKLQETYGHNFNNQLCDNNCNSSLRYDVFKFNGPFKNEQIRNNLFFPPDATYIQSLGNNDIKATIYNPTEDKILFSNISGIITEKDCLRIYDLDDKENIGDKFPDEIEWI